MSIHMSRLVATAALTALLAACGNGGEDEAAAAAASGTAAGTANSEIAKGGGAEGEVDVAELVIEPEPESDDSAAARPLELDLSAEHVEIKVILPEAAARDAELYGMLVAQAEAEAGESREIAAEDAAYAEEQGFPVRDHFLEIKWETTFEDDSHVSLLKTTYLFQGGAHPNTYFDAVNWLYDDKAEFEAADLMADPAGYQALSDAAREAIMAAKRERLGDGLSDEDYWTDQVMDATAPMPENFDPFTLAPAAGEPGKAGGLTLHYSPYTLGPYAEGDYHIVIPQAVFAEYLSDAYAPLFAGEPAQD